MQRVHESYKFNTWFECRITVPINKAVDYRLTRCLSVLDWEWTLNGSKVKGPSASLSIHIWRGARLDRGYQVRSTEYNTVRVALLDIAPNWGMSNASSFPRRPDGTTHHAPQTKPVMLQARRQLKPPPVPIILVCVSWDISSSSFLLRSRHLPPSSPSAFKSPCATCHRTNKRNSTLPIHFCKTIS